MRETNGRSRRVSTKLTALAAGLVAIFAVAAFGTSSAQASTAGQPISTEFNYVGINVGVSIAGEVNEIVLTPDTPDPNNPGGFLPPLEMNGAYTNSTGNFTLPQANGLVFPDIALDLGDGIEIEAEIGLTAPALGNYNDATGEMSVNPKISLTLGTDAMENLPEDFPISGEGPLKCQIAPLDVNLSTSAVNWLADGAAFTDKANIKEGRLAGGWNTKPKVVSVAEDPSNASLCPLIGGLLDPVGGLFLANSTPDITEMPSFSGTKLTPRPCDAGTTGTPGTPQSECKLVPPKQCEEGTTGTFPNCVPIVVDEKTPYKVSKVAIAPSKGKIKAGKTLKLKIKVTNSGETDGSSKVVLKSSNKKAIVPKSITISVPAGETASKSITVKAKKTAKGKATVSAKAGGKTGTATLKIIKKKKKK